MLGPQLILIISLLECQVEIPGIYLRAGGDLGWIFFAEVGPAVDRAGAMSEIPQRGGRSWCGRARKEAGGVAPRPPESSPELDRGVGPGSWMRRAQGQDCWVGSLSVRWKRLKN